MPADKTPVAVFVRAPIAGRTKTRLATALGEQGAAALYAAFLRDTLTKVRAEPLLQATLWAASAEDAAFFEHARTQPDGDLGERMEAALRDGIAQAGRAIVLGSDAPTLPPRILRASLDALDRAEVVLGPAADGGYYLIGVRNEAFPLVPVRWSTRSALADTIACAQGRRIALLPPWYDIDTAADLRLLRAHLALRPRAAPATAIALGFDPAVDLQ
jgi:rSAM/selenodomain-associated transferase 1